MKVFVTVQVEVGTHLAHGASPFFFFFFNVGSSENTTLFCTMYCSYLNRAHCESCACLRDRWVVSLSPISSSSERNRHAVEAQIFYFLH